MTEFLNPAETQLFQLKDDGIIPNNRLPLLVYKNAVKLSSRDPASVFERLFAANSWQGSWRNGIFRFQHFHSTAHEVLGVFRGSATVQLGGDSGTTQKLAVGDVVVIPAGVGHKNLGSSADFAVVGAYPAGQEHDMCYGKPEERPQADSNISSVPLPNSDPVYGVNGPLMSLWK